MSLQHAAALHFGGRPDAAKKRIQRLKAAGFIAERPRKTFEESILFLTRRAFQALNDAGQLADFPKLSLSVWDKRAKVSNLTINHELSVMQIKVAFAKAVAERAALTVAQFSTWPRRFSFVSPTWLNGFRMQPGTVKPDGFVRLHEETDDATTSHAFFVEVDLTNESFNKLAGKAGAYLHYYSSGGFAVWRGARREEYKKRPFRVLGIFAKEKRKMDFAYRLLANIPPIRNHWYLASYADAIRDPLGPIWTTPADYGLNNGDAQSYFGATPPIPQRALISGDSAIVPKHPAEA